MRNENMRRDLVLILSFVCIIISVASVSGYDFAEVTDIYNETYNVTNLTAEYHVQPSSFAASWREFPKLYLWMNLQEGSITYLESFEIPFASIRNLTFNWSQNEPAPEAIIELSNGTSIQINNSLFEKRNADGKLINAVSLRPDVMNYDFATTSDLSSERLTKFSGVGTTRNGRKGSFSIEFHEVKGIEFI
jgi:hypothetical protein